MSYLALIEELEELRRLQEAKHQIQEKINLIEKRICICDRPDDGMYNIKCPKHGNLP